MRETIAKILDEIPQGNIFDSHYVIFQLIKFHSDVYLTFAGGINADVDRTIIAHGNIGREIATFVQEGIISQLDAHSWSENIHGRSNFCTAWKKLL